MFSRAIEGLIQISERHRKSGLCR